MSPLHVTYRPVGELVAYVGNARTHSPAQVKAIAASIREFGFNNPVLIDGEGGIIAGHGRVLAAELLELTEVPCIELPHLTPAQKRAYVLADNQIALNAGWDPELLALELQALAAQEIDLGLLGFSHRELEHWLGDGALKAGKTDENEIPTPLDAPVSRPGDLWLLGSHRLLCGDATSAADVALLLGDVVPHLMVTDPPYGVRYDPAWRRRAGVNNSERMGAVRNDDCADWSGAWALFRGEVTYVWHGALHAVTVAQSLVASGFDIRAQIVWAKARLVLGRGDYHWQHEPCWYAVRKAATGHWSGDRTQTTLWSIDSGHQDAETAHSTQKPVECMRRPILNNSAPGEAVYEPFCGSGTTLVAAEQTRRCAYALEIDPVYVDVAVQRWQAFTGEAATLQGTGQIFAEVAQERAQPLAA